MSVVQTPRTAVPDLAVPRLDLGLGRKVVSPRLQPPWGRGQGWNPTW